MSEKQRDADEVETAVEPQEPETQYDKDRREAVRQAVAEGRTLSERKSWEAAAAISRQRIAAKYPGKHDVSRLTDS